MIYRSEAELSQMDPAERQKMSTEDGAFTRSFVQSISRQAMGCSRRRRPAPFASATARSWQPTARLPRRANSSAAAIWALELVDALAARGGLDGYDLLPAVRADLPRRLGRHGAAREAYFLALPMSRLEPLRRHYSRRLAQLSTGA
jgi:hypothetical protein